MGFVAFCLGLAVGVLHWRLFLAGVGKLQASTGGGQRQLWRLSVGLCWMRLLITTGLLVLLIRSGLPYGPLAAGLVVSAIGFRVFAYRRGKSSR